MARTEITPKQLFERRNTDDIFDRSVLVGLLRVFNRRLYYQQVWDDTEQGIQNVCVPFFYDFGGSNNNSEKFIQDNYTNFTSEECSDIGIKKIDGNFDFYPQGRLSMSGINIESGNITNRFVMGKYTRREKGKLKSYVSYLYSMPLTYTFSVEIRCESMNVAMKINQAYREFFYKNLTFHINYKGTVVPVRVGFPESAYQPQSGGQYTFGQMPGDTFIKIPLTIQCETYQPIFDPYNERPADSSMYNMGLGVWVNREHSPETVEGPLRWITDFEDMVLVCGQDLLVEWRYSYQDRDLLQVDILYEDETGEQYLLDSVDNHNFYHWRIPMDFIDNPSRVDIIIPNTDDCTVYTVPEIYIYPDPETHIVDESTVYVLNKGYFITSKQQVDAIISYESKNGQIIEVPAKLNLKNFMIDETNPIEFECFVYSGNINAKPVKLVLRDHHNLENICVSDQILIV